MIRVVDDGMDVERSKQKLSKQALKELEEMYERPQGGEVPVQSKKKRDKKDRD